MQYGEAVIEEVGTRQQVLEAVTAIAAHQVGMASDAVREDSKLVADLGCDSLDVVEISLRLEERYELSLPDEFTDQDRSVGEVTDIVLQLLEPTSPV